MARTTRKSRQQLIVDVLEDAFAPLMTADPKAFRGKFRKMAADPFAFYRGSACLFYADMTKVEDPWADDRTGAVWIHGDLHAENFGTYMDSDGRLVFDVNDFDEAYIGHFSWDLRRFVASLALLGWQKALPEDDIRQLIGAYLRAYLAQVSHYVQLGRPGRRLRAPPRQHRGPDQRHPRARAPVEPGRTCSTGSPAWTDDVRVFREDTGVRRLGKAERRKVEQAFASYLETIPESKKFDRELFYEVARPGRQVRLRHRQRRAPGLQRAGRGLQPVARQRRRALHEAGATSRR